MTGARIKQYLSEKGIKHSVVAAKAVIPANTFSAMLNENRRITAEEYFAICRAIDVPLETFATET